MGANQLALHTIQSGLRASEVENSTAPDWFLNSMVVLCTVRVTFTGGVSLRQQMLLPLIFSNGILQEDVVLE